MSYYYKYKFVSPEPIFSRIKEEMRSYIDTGVIDDVLFPVYLKDCIDDIGLTAFKIKETPLEIINGQATLPDDFVSVRELFACVDVEKKYVDPTATYTQTTTQVTPYLDSCQDCELEDKVVTVKTTGELSYSYGFGGLLRPGNITTADKCAKNCGNLFSNDPQTFDIHDNKLVTNFTTGMVHLIYYSLDTDENGYQLIPDVKEFKSYIEYYIKFKCYETLFNSVSDETFNQVYTKYQVYKRECDSKKIIADTELKRQTIYDVARSITRSRKRFNFYEKRLWGKTIRRW